MPATRRQNKLQVPKNEIRDLIKELRGDYLLRFMETSCKFEDQLELIRAEELRIKTELKEIAEKKTGFERRQARLIKVWGKLGSKDQELQTKIKGRLGWLKSKIDELETRKKEVEDKEMAQLDEIRQHTVQTNEEKQREAAIHVSTLGAILKDNS